MKKIFLSLILFLFFAVPAFAQTARTNRLIAQEPETGTSSARQTIKTTVEQNRIEDLKTRAKTEITRRINFLNDLSAKISVINKLSDADKTTLKTQIQQQTDGLTTLLAKINADTDLPTLKTDVKSIVNGYYIFAFFRVKISLLVAAERLTVAADNMNLVYNKLSVRVADEKAKGKVTTSLEVLLKDMLTKITDSKTQYAAVETSLSTLDAQGYPANKTSLTAARAKIKIGAQDLNTAFQDAAKIRQSLGGITGDLKLKNGSSSALKSSTFEK
jgi:ABC-type microcin C transport system duplicated ATPase subunit YejF